MLKLEQIKSLHVELTTRCNARCPMCPRNFRGMDYNSGYPEVDLDLDKFKKIFKPNFLKQITNIALNGNLGDCSLVSDLPHILNYIYQSSTSQVTISTNASTRKPAWWAGLANPRLVIFFDLDGLEDTHKLYRLDTDWYKVIKNAIAYIQNGGYAVWKMIVFDHNRHQIEQCRALSVELGFKNFWPVYSNRNQGPVFSRHGEFSHWLGYNNGSKPLVQELISFHLLPGTPNDSDLLQAHGREGCVIKCQHIQDKGLYVSADGSVYPCCFLGFYPGHMNHPGNSQLVKIVRQNNALEYDLDHCIKWFDQIQESWKLESTAQGKLVTCVNSCGVTQ